jgi:hypothetical protein
MTSRLLFNRWALFLAIIFGTLIGVFGRDLLEAGFGAASGMVSADPVASADAVVRGADFVFMSPGRNLSDLQVRDLGFTKLSGMSVSIGFNLTSRGRGSSYPSLRVSMFSSTGKLMRDIDFKPSDYEHGDTLTSDHVVLNVERAPGEASFNVAPFYADSGEAR